MPELEEKFKISPEREAKIKAETERLQPLRDTLNRLSEQFSLADIYGELAHILFNFSANIIFLDENDCDTESSIKYVAKLASDSFSEHEKWDGYFESILREGVIVDGPVFLVSVAMEIVTASSLGYGYEEVFVWMHNEIANSRWYKQQLAKTAGNASPTIR